MTAPATTPLSYNLYVQQLGVLAVAITQNTAGVWGFQDAPLQTLLPQALNYAELRIQRDLDFLNARSANTYALTAGSNLFTVPINDFLIVDTLEILQTVGGSLLNQAGQQIYNQAGQAISPAGSSSVVQIVNSYPLTAASREFIQNCFGGIAQAGTPKWFAMYGDTFGNGADQGLNILLGPIPNFAFPVRVTGVIRMPTLAQYDEDGFADTSFTYISQFLPDMLLMASMIYISAFQRQFSSTSDDPNMGQSYEKQYQALRLAAIAEENRKKFMGSGWSSYSTPVSATPAR
jgi:hypothetical protein